MKTLSYFSEEEDRKFTNLVIKYNTLENEDEKLKLENSIKERTMILLYLIPQRYLYISEEDAGGFFLEIQKDADEIIASFRISSLTFNRYLQQTCRYRCMRYMRNQSRRKATERALIFSDMTIHEKQLSENLIPYSSPESTEAVEKMDLGSISDFIIRRKGKKIVSLSESERKLSMLLERPVRRRQFIEFLLALPETETPGFIAGISRLLRIDYHTASRFYSLRHEAMMNENGNEIKALQELSGRHWTILSKLGIATSNESDPEQREALYTRYRRMRKIYDKRLSDLQHAHSGLHHTTISEILGVSRPMVSADIKKVKTMLTNVMGNDDEIHCGK